jgi:hypothetical protein
VMSLGSTIAGMDLFPRAVADKQQQIVTDS